MNASGNVCSCCGKPLTDPISIEIGMEPVCRVEKKNIGVKRDRWQRDMFSEGSDFIYSIVKAGSVLAIEDLDKGNISVTNDIENVLVKIARDEGLPLAALAGMKAIVYRDSQGVWDGVRINKVIGERAVVAEFYSVNRRTMVEAVEEALNKITIPPRSRARDDRGR